MDEYTRVALGCLVAGTIGSSDVVAFLETLFERHGVPAGIRSDNGREFVSVTAVNWLKEREVEPIFVEKASPQQNSFIERFNGTMRDEVLNGEEFQSVLEARVVITQWLDVYNEHRPHRGLGMMTPQALAMAHNVGGKMSLLADIRSGRTRRNCVQSQCWSTRTTPGVGVQLRNWTKDRGPLTKYPLGVS